MSEQPTITCPNCGVTAEDFDGLGVLACPADPPCNYCTHPGFDRQPDGSWVCCICDEERDE